MHGEAEGIQGSKSGAGAAAWPCERPVRIGRAERRRSCAKVSSSRLLETAWRAERVLARRYEVALECASDAFVRGLWIRARADACRRADELVRVLDAAGAARPSDPEVEDDCFVEAMAMALRNGDRVAAEIVARECVVLAEAQCAAVRERLLSAAATPSTAAARSVSLCTLRIRIPGHADDGEGASALA
jgi:hypothetical protein